MTEASLKAITRDDVVAYYKETYTPKGTYLTIVGDITIDNAKAMVDKYFGKWTGDDSYINPSLGIKPMKGNQVFFVKKPGAVQSVINIAFPVDIKPGSDDQIASTVLNNIMGGGVLVTV